MIEDPCMVCGAESDYGAHGISNGEVYDEYYCEKCYHAKNRRGTTEEVEEKHETAPDRGPTPENNEVRPSLPVSELGDGAVTQASA